MLRRVAILRVRCLLSMSHKVSMGSIVSKSSNHEPSISILWRDVVGISETTQDYVSRLWPFFGCGGGLYRLQAHLPFPPSLVIMSTRPNKG